MLKDEAKKIALQCATEFCGRCNQTQLLARYNDVDVTRIADEFVKWLMKE